MGHVQFLASNPVIAVKGIRIGEYNGSKTIGTQRSSGIEINPEIQEAYKLKSWWESEGNNAAFVSSGNVAGGSKGAGTFEERKTIDRYL